ncbi:MAG: Holliday junction resolvase RuvX [Candidatus Krumholzibacteriia bacterium]
MAPVLGIDYGVRRIGIAVSDPTDTLATAVGTHHEGRDGSVLALLRGLVAERGVTEVVVGWPLTTGGEVGDMARRAARFADRLREELELPVVLADERFSSAEAAARLRETGRRRAPRGTVDAAAAEIILQQHLDQRRARGPESS